MEAHLMKLVLHFNEEEMELELGMNSLFVRLPWAGQVYKQRGERAVWDSWKTIKAIENR
jgi:hypothetical protein